MQCITNPKAYLCIRDKEDKGRSSSSACIIFDGKTPRPTNSEIISSYKKIAINPKLIQHILLEWAHIILPVFHNRQAFWPLLYMFKQFS